MMILRDRKKTHPQQDVAHTRAYLGLQHQFFAILTIFPFRTSKLCNVLFTYDLARRLQKKKVSNVSVCAYNPGFMPGTGLARDYHPILKWAWDKILPAIGKLRGWERPDRSGRYLARLVSDTEAFADVDNRYFVPGPIEIPSSVDSYDRPLQRALWNLSARLVKLDRSETPFKIKKSEHSSSS
jgi:hypothetical protein